MLAEQADLLVVTSARLAERFLDNDPLLVPNGADFQHFAGAEANRAPAPVHDLPRPVIGYCGSISHWFDFDLLGDVAARLSNWSFVLVGDARHHVDRVKRLPGNVRWLGRKPYEELPRYVAAFDACIIPFRTGSLAEATSPVKLYEYLSAGKPVVATRLRELAPLAGLVHLADDAPSFVTALEAARSESDPETSATRVDFARANTWERRYEELDVGIRSVIGSG